MLHDLSSGFFILIIIFGNGKACNGGDYMKDQLDDCDSWLTTSGSGSGNIKEDKLFTTLAGADGTTQPIPQQPTPSVPSQSMLPPQREQTEKGENEEEDSLYSEGYLEHSSDNTIKHHTTYPSNKRLPLFNIHPSTSYPIQSGDDLFSSDLDNEAEVKNYLILDDPTSSSFSKLLPLTSYPKLAPYLPNPHCRHIPDNDFPMQSNQIPKPYIPRQIDTATQSLATQITYTLMEMGVPPELNSNEFLPLIYNCLEEVATIYHASRNNY